MAKKSKYKNIPLFPETKEKLEEIRHELDGIHKKRLSFDETVGYLIEKYNDTKKLEKEEKTKKTKGKSSLDNIKVGDIIPDLHNKEIEITDELLEQMRNYELETNKSAIYRNKITGSFLDFNWTREKKSKKTN